MGEEIDEFISLLPENGTVLDLGCGSGRDSSYFIDHGFDVTALDASEEMCNLASIHIGQDVLCLSFQEIGFKEVFDGVWANASLLHVSREEMHGIMLKIIRSLRDDGILYMSFYHGNYEGIRDKRHYTDYRTKTLKELVLNFPQLEIVDIKKTQDKRPDRDDMWVYAIVRKISSL